jgi:transposase
MSTANSKPGKGQVQEGPFGKSELPQSELREAAAVEFGGTPRLLYAERHQVELRPMDLDATLAPNHPARTAWAFVQSIPLYASVKSRAGGRGTPAIDPAILVSLWLWATIDGIGSAREVDRLCECYGGYRWLCGGVDVTTTMADFRTGNAAWLDAQLACSIASLLDRKLVELNVVQQDGRRVRASAKAASFRRLEKLQHLHRLAQTQVIALKRELTEDAGASARRKQVAVERAAREREQRLAKAIATMDEIASMPEPKKPKPSKRRGKGQDDPPAGGGAAPAEPAKPSSEPRVSMTDPEARVMNMAAWRSTMASEWGQALYKCTWRAASAECANVQLRWRGPSPSSTCPARPCCCGTCSRTTSCACERSTSPSRLESRGRFGP